MQTDRSKINVLHIPRWYPNHHDPMPGLFAKNHIDSLIGRCSNSVLYLHFSTKQAGRFVIEKSETNDVFTCIIYIKKASCRIVFISQLINAFKYWQAFLKGYRLVRTIRNTPDIVHVHVLTRPAIPALYLKWKYGIPYLISEHWSRYFPEHNGYKGFIRKKLTHLALKKSEALICVSVALQKAMQKHGLQHNNHFIIPNIVDTKLFQPTNEKPLSKAPELIHISCFENKSKNISGLLEAIALLKSNKIRVKLHLAGDGEDKPELERYAKELGLNSQDIIFHGLLMPEELANKLRNADFLIQTSNYETFSTAVVESLACGVPVISTPVGIFPEIYEPSIGIMIPSGKADDIAHAIETAGNRKYDYNTDYLQSITDKQFSKESIGKALTGIYLSVIEKLKK